MPEALFLMSAESTENSSVEDVSSIHTDDLWVNPLSEEKEEASEYGSSEFTGASSEDAETEEESEETDEESTEEDSEETEEESTKEEIPKQSEESEQNAEENATETKQSETAENGPKRQMSFSYLYQLMGEEVPDEVLKREAMEDQLIEPILDLCPKCNVELSKEKAVTFNPCKHIYCINCVLNSFGENIETLFYQCPVVSCTSSYPATKLEEAFPKPVSAFRQYHTQKIEQAVLVTSLVDPENDGKQSKKEKKKEKRASKKEKKKERKMSKRLENLSEAKTESNEPEMNVLSSSDASTGRDDQHSKENSNREPKKVSITSPRLSPEEAEQKVKMALKHTSALVLDLMEDSNDSLNVEGTSKDSENDKRDVRSESEKEKETKLSGTPSNILDDDTESCTDTQLSATGVQMSITSEEPDKTTISETKDSEVHNLVGTSTDVIPNACSSEPNITRTKKRKTSLVKRISMKARSEALYSKGSRSSLSRDNSSGVSRSSISKQGGTTSRLKNVLSVGCPHCKAPVSADPREDIVICPECDHGFCFACLQPMVIGSPENHCCVSSPDVYDDDSDCDSSMQSNKRRPSRSFSSRIISFLPPSVRNVFSRRTKGKAAKERE